MLDPPPESLLPPPPPASVGVAMGMPPLVLAPVEAGAGVTDCGVYLGARGITGSAPGIGVASGAPALVSGVVLSAGGRGGGGAMGPLAAGSALVVEIA